MNADLELKLQAYLDGELPATEAREMAELISQDKDSQRLLSELKDLSSTLRSNEPAVSLPVTGEFYWAQIERQIASPSLAKAQARQPVYSWIKWLFPLGISALLVLGFFRLGPGHHHGTIIADEIETQLPDASFFSFRSQVDGISVVWVDTEATRGIAANDDDFY
jgi:anti-sigma factor RsiW